MRLVHPALAASAAPRVLCVRSCRPEVFETALEALRRAYPAGTMTVVAPRGAPAPAAEGCVTTEIPRRRFGLRAALGGRLRGELGGRFDLVCVPQMFAAPLEYLNVYRFALGIPAAAVATYSPDAGLRRFGRLEFLAWAARHVWNRAVDVPVSLGLAVVAAFRPRRPAVPGTSPPRVLCVITSWGVGGAQRQLAEFLRGVPPGAAHVRVFALSAADGDFASRHVGDRAFSVTYSRHWPALRPTIHELAALCRRERIDVVHTWLFLANFVGAVGARLAGVPRVIGSVRNLSLWKRTWANRWWFRVADALAARLADVVTVNAASLVADHASWAILPPRRIQVVPNGLTAPDICAGDEARAAVRARLGLPSGTLLVGTVGRLAEEKDHTALLRAWETAASRHPGAVLVIKGTGPLAGALGEQATAGTAAVVFDHDPAGALAFIAGLDLFVLPSRIEGFANVLLEAAQIGVPVLATEVGAAREVVADDEDLVPVADVPRLAARLETTLGDLPAARTRAAARRLRVLRDFTAGRMVARWLSLYHGAHR